MCVWAVFSVIQVYGYEFFSKTITVAVFDL